MNPPDPKSLPPSRYPHGSGSLEAGLSDAIEQESASHQSPQATKACMAARPTQWPIDSSITPSCRLQPHALRCTKIGQATKIALTSQELNTMTWVRVELHICSVPLPFDETLYAIPASPRARQLNAARDLPSRGTTVPFLKKPGRIRYRLAHSS